MKRATLILVVVASLVLLMPTAVRADMYSVSAKIGNPGSVSVDPFDSTKGTLTGVSWTAIVKPYVDVQFTNNTSQTIDSGTLSVTTVSVSGSAPDGSTGSASGSGSIQFFFLDPGKPEYFDFHGSLSLPSTTVDASKLSFYEGPGQASFTFPKPTYTLGTPPAGVSITDSFSEFDPGGTVTVTYTFTPAATAAPEPASLTLFGIGAVGMLGYGWRRRRQSA